MIYVLTPKGRRVCAKYIAKGKDPGDKEASNGFFGTLTLELCYANDYCDSNHRGLFLPIIQAAIEKGWICPASKEQILIYSLKGRQL